ncbi:MAG: hypothetical protein WDM85_06305 [Caulobacteraceae bacterium]
MPIVQLLLLGLIISGFLIFMVTLLSVSIYVSLGSPTPKPVARTVTPARRFDEHRAGSPSAGAAN